MIGLSRARTYLPELEALRGIAVLLVVSFHMDGRVRFLTTDVVSVTPWNSFMRAGHNGVDLFFVLSAFLLTLPMLDDARPFGAAEVRVFWARRALRILPLYWAAVLVGAALTSTSAADLLRALPYLVFLNAVAGMHTPMEPWSGVWWSLATEMQFYAVLPELGLARRRRVWRWVGVLLLAAWAVAYVGMLRGWYHFDTIAGMFKLVHSLVGRAPLFLWGIAAAWLYHRYGTAWRARLAGQAWLRAGGADAVLVGLAVALAFFLAWIGGLPTTRQEGPAFQWWHIVAGALWTGVLLVLLLAPLRSRRLLVNPVLVRLGVLSYSIYLLHVPVIDYTLDVLRMLPEGWTITGARGLPVPITTLFYRWQPATVVIGILQGVLMVAVSSLTYRWIERPFLARKARVDVPERRAA